MERLVYRPKVWAYVKASGGSAPVDISPYIVNGEVERVVNDVSTATITIRNPDFMFTTPGDATFKPMDPITIFMARNVSRPVRVFTGFLDETGYLQLFPGTITLKASCTIKRLKHTYWDPALPFTKYFMMKYNWLQAEDGTTVNLGASISETVLKKNYEDTVVIEGELNDSGLASLLSGTMQAVGNWAPDDLLIEPLPSSLMNDIDKLWNDLNSERKETRAALKAFLKKAIGDPPEEVAVSASPSDAYDGAPASDGAGLTQVKAGETYDNPERGKFKIPAEHAKNLVWWHKGTVAIAKWMAPQLVWAKDNGWDGRLTNGFRTYKHQSIIYNSGVRPAAKPGQSRHEGSAYPKGAIDVSSAQQLRDVLKKYKGDRKLKWALDVGFNDPPHFSSSGY